MGRDHPAELPLYVPEAAMNAEWPDDELYGLWEDKEWESLFPRGNGWVTLGPNDEMFVLSMYHQLHCLSVSLCVLVYALSKTLKRLRSFATRLSPRIQAPWSLGRTGMGPV